MTRRSFLFAGLRGAFLGAAITTGLASVQIPEERFVRGKLRASDITRARKAFEQAYREAVIEAIDVKPLVLGPAWGA